MSDGKPNSFLESSIYRHPHEAFHASTEKLRDDERVWDYLDQVLKSHTPKDPAHQEAVRPALEALLTQNRKEEAGLLFNLHRIFTEFSGYGPNEKASSDVQTCFGDALGIPAQGAITVDFFATRNLPRIVELCERQAIDLGRIRVAAPKAILAAQLMRMVPEKREEFENVCSKLREDQFITPEVNHNADIPQSSEEAVWFSPRTMPICPRLHGESETESIRNYCEWYRSRVAGLVNGGRAYANLAYGENWEPLRVETVSGKRTLTKLTGISRNAASSVAEHLVDELGFWRIGQGEFNPADKNPRIDHAKLAQELHVIRL